MSAHVPAVVMRWADLVEEKLAEFWPGLLHADGTSWVLAQLWQESAGNPNAISPAGAVGLMQLMPATATEVGVSERRDPDQSVMGGVIYLHRQYERLPSRAFGANYPHVTRLLLALASYNCGRGYIEAALRLQREDGDREWWTWRAVSEALPAARVRGRTAIVEQVRDYVDRISRRQPLVARQLNRRGA